MVSTYTTNKFLEEPARGDLVGTWDTAVNGNSDIIDAAFGGTTTLVLNNSNVSLSSGQYRNTFLTLTGTITANIAITLPLVGSVYTVENQTAGTFYITLQTTAAGSQVVGCPPYIPFSVKTSTDGNVKYMNLGGPVGGYMDWAGSSVPIWMTACTIPPYLNCDGTAFSSATYPALATVLGGTTLPNATRVLSETSFVQPTKQYLTSGSTATYTLTSSAITKIFIQMIGGGGGGGAQATNSGSAGGTTTFDSVSAAGGSGGFPGTAGVATGGAGGTGGAGSASLRLQGGAGGCGIGLGSGDPVGGMGGNGPFGGAGRNGQRGQTAGQPAMTNTGAGGGGAGGFAVSAGGGGAGEYVEYSISSPSSTYTYTIGSAGAGGTAGTNAGGAGGSGLIIVTEFYAQTTTTDLTLIRAA